MQHNIYNSLHPIKTDQIYKWEKNVTHNQEKKNKTKQSIDTKHTQKDIGNGICRQEFKKSLKYAKNDKYMYKYKNFFYKSDC